MFLLLIGVLLLSVAANPALFATIPNPDNLDSLTIAKDYSLALFYKPRSYQTLLLDPYTWFPLKDQKQYFKFDGALTIDFFEDGDSTTNIIYSNRDGQIRVRKYYQSEYKDFLVYKNSNFWNLGSLAVSSDGSKWAAYCKGGSTIYFGNLTQYKSDPFTFTLQDVQISDVAWRPDSHHLVVSGYNSTTKYSVAMYIDAEKDSISVLRLTEDMVLSLAFGLTNNDLYFLTRHSAETGQDKVNRYYFSNQTIERRGVGYSCTKIMVRPYCIGIMSANFWYIYRMDSNQFTTENTYLKIYDSENCNGKAPDSAVMVVRRNTSSATQQSIQIYKSCISKEFFSLASGNCQPCSLPCAECFRSATNCIACESRQNYPDKYHRCVPCSSSLTNCLTCGARADGPWCETCEEDYLVWKGACEVCDDVIDGCQVCKDNSTCTSCLYGYLHTQNHCEQCSVLIEGCQNCESSKKCLKCQDAFHEWILNGNHTCSRCSAVLEGCRFCYTAEICSGCQEDYGLVVDHCKPCGVIFQGCKYCSSYSCSVCEEGYEWSGGACQERSSYWWAYLLGGLAVVAGVVLGVWKWRKWRNRKNKMAQPSQQSGGSSKYVQQSQRSGGSSLKVSLMDAQEVNRRSGAASSKGSKSSRKKSAGSSIGSVMSGGMSSRHSQGVGERMVREEEEV